MTPTREQLLADFITAAMPHLRWRGSVEAWLVLFHEPPESKGRIRMGMARLAALTGMSEDHAHRAMKYLRQKGMVTTVTRGTGKTGEGVHRLLSRREWSNPNPPRRTQSRRPNPPKSKPAPAKQAAAPRKRASQPAPPPANPKPASDAGTKAAPAKLKAAGVTRRDSVIRTTPAQVHKADGVRRSKPSPKSAPKPRTRPR